MEIVSKMPRSPQISNALQLLQFFMMDGMDGGQQRGQNESGRKNLIKTCEPQIATNHIFIILTYKSKLGKFSRRTHTFGFYTWTLAFCLSSHDLFLFAISRHAINNHLSNGMRNVGISIENWAKRTTSDVQVRQAPLAIWIVLAGLYLFSFVNLIKLVFSLSIGKFELSTSLSVILFSRARVLIQIIL